MISESTCIGFRVLGFGCYGVWGPANGRVVHGGNRHDLIVNLDIFGCEDAGLNVRVEPSGLRCGEQCSTEANPEA